MAKRRKRKVNAKTPTGAGTDSTAVDNGMAAPEKISKADAVRACLKAGVEKPQEAVGWIKEKFGIEMAPQVFSSYKSSLGRKAESTSSHGAPGRKSGAVDLATVEDVKELVSKVGAAQVRKLVGLFE